ncbi:MAG: glycosyltransferase [Desulfarculus sp.]|nr:glycosyltransferase [Desulfarculus sp.]
MDFWKENLAALARRAPALAHLLEESQPHPQARLEPSRSGAPGLIVGQARLTSSVDPVAEGKGLATRAPDGPLVALGFGLGYHLEPLLGRDLLIWEPDPRLLRLALTARDLRPLMEGARLVVDPGELGDLQGRSLYLHRPSARLYPVEVQGLERRLAAPPAARQSRPRRPRVMVVPAIFGGSLPVAYWCGQALEALGCQVLTLPLDQVAPLHQRLLTWRGPLERLDRVRAPLIRFLGELTVLEAEKSPPDLLLALAQAPLDRKAIKDLKDLGVATAFWFVEDFRLMAYFREVAAAYDFFFHIQGPELERELDGLGANHAYLPMAAHPPVHCPRELTPAQRREYGAPVGFMGAGYPNRQRIFKDLVARGLNLRLWGVGWRGLKELEPFLAQERYLDSEEVVAIYNACQVVINLHSSPLCETRVGGADFVNPRTLEVPACGGFQLVDRVRGLEDFLVPGREVAVFDNEDQLLEMTAHYLRHPGERAAMAQAGRRRVLAQHTYYHRMEALLTRCLGPAAPVEMDGAAQAAGLAALAQGRGAGPQTAAQWMLERLAPGPGLN